jgi:tRNA modification GTPase
VPSEIPRLYVHNKIDLQNIQGGVIEDRDTTHLYVSAKTGEGINTLQEKILGMIGWHNESGVFMARARHLDAIDQAKQHLLIAGQQFPFLEIIAEELRQAQLALNQITGEFVADDLLGQIFSRFCIGK